MNGHLYNWVYGVCDASIRFGLIFLVALAISRFGHANPHRQSTLWRTVLVGLVVVTLWSFAIPRWNWDIPVAAKATRLNVSSNHVPTDPADDMELAVVQPDRIVRDADVGVLEDRPIRSASIAAPAEASLVESDSTSWANKLMIGLLALWSLVALALLIRIVNACLAINSLRHSCKQVAFQQSDVYQCDAIHSPMVAGFFKPRILLPPQCNAWSQEKLQAVVAHERAHIARHDIWFAVFAEFLAALYWFHPCVWLTKRFLRSSAELACDYAAIQNGNDRFAYARVLLDVAGRADEHRLLHLAMASPGQVRQRITQILASTIASNMYLTRRQKFTLYSSLGLCFLSFCVWAPRLISQEGQKYLPKTYAASDRFSSNNGRTQVVIHGVVLNPDGTLATDARVTTTTWSDLYYENKSKQQIDCRDGRFVLTIPGLTNVDFLVRNPDDTLMCEQAVLAVDMRNISEKDLVLQLEKSKRFTVKVTNLKPNERCHVLAGNAQSNYEALVAPDGLATIRIPPHAEVFSVNAWTDTKRIGWQDFRPWRNRPYHYFAAQIELVETETIQIDLQDSQGKPLGNAKVIASFATDEDVTLDPSFFTAITDANGNATIESVPRLENLKSRFYVNKSVVLTQELNDRVVRLTAPASPIAQVPFRGQLQLPPGCEGGLLVSGRSFQNVVSSLSTPFSARCDAQGNFEGLVTPGYTYSLFIDDDLWVSDNWDGILVGTEDQPANRFQLSVERGAQTTVVLTGGENNEPLPDRYIHFALDHTMQWREDGKTQYGGGGRFVQSKTDRDGRAFLMLFPGEYQLSCTNGQAFVEKKIQIEAGNSNNFDLHFDVVGKRKIAGRLTGDSNAIAGASVSLRQADRFGEIGTKVQSSADGTFSGEIDANQTLVYAVSSDGAYAATKLFDTVSGDFVLEMKQSASLSGQVLDSDNEPVINGEVSAIVELQNPKYQKESTNIPEEIRVKRLDLKTDADGRFYVDKLPALTKVMVTMNTGPSTFRYLELVVLQPGEKRTSVYDYKKRTELPFESRLSRLLNDNALMHTHTLVVIHSGDERSKDFTSEHALNYKDHRNVAWYLPLVLDAKTMAQKPDTLSGFQRRDWPTPAADSLWLLALDDKSNELGRVELDVTSEVSLADSVSKLERFLRDNRVAELDANAALAAALKDARQTDRSVWLSISQTRCQPCFTLARWQDEQKALLSKAFVMLKIDNIRDIGGNTIMRALDADNSVPWHVMIDSQGKPLINSKDPILGNIGAPENSPESIPHFRRMLQTGSRGKLTADEIESLLRSLPPG